MCISVPFQGNAFPWKVGVFGQTQPDSARLRNSHIHKQNKITASFRNCNYNYVSLCLWWECNKLIGNNVIFNKFSALAARDVSKITTHDGANDANFLKMTFWYYRLSDRYSRLLCVLETRGIKRQSNMIFFPSSGECKYIPFPNKKSRGGAVSSAQTIEACEKECSGNSLCRAYEFNDSPERPWRGIRCRLHETHELYVEASSTVDSYVREPCFEAGRLLHKTHVIACCYNC